MGIFYQPLVGCPGWVEDAPTNDESRWYRLIAFSLCVCVLCVCMSVCFYLFVVGEFSFGWHGGWEPGWEWCGVGGVGGGHVSPIRDVIPEEALPCFSNGVYFKHHSKSKG